MKFQSLIAAIMHGIGPAARMCAFSLRAAASVEDVSESDQPVVQAAGVKHLGVEADCQIFVVGSRRYAFTSNTLPVAESIA